MATIEKQPDGPIVVMIDNETLALGPDAFVTQVGLVVVNTKTGEILEGPYGYWLTTEGQEARTIDPGTVRWWMQQDPAVIKSVFAPPSGMTRTTPQELFDNFAVILRAYPDATVWASPAMFDLSMLTHLWGGKKPWRYNQERDMMTLYKLLDPTGVLQPKAIDNGHNAVADAKWQAEYLVNLLRHLHNGAGMGPAEWAMKLSRIPGDPVKL